MGQRLKSRSRSRRTARGEDEEVEEEEEERTEGEEFKKKRIAERKWLGRAGEGDR